MLMADALAITLSIVGFLLALNALWFVCYGFWTGLAERAADRVTRQPIRSLIVGAVVSTGVLFAVIVLGQGPGVMKVLSIGLMCAYLFYAQIGTAGLVTALGRRLPSPADLERPWKATMRGGLALSLSYVLPVLGWFMILPITWVMGAGAAVLEHYRAPRAAPKAAPPPSDAMFAPTVVESAEAVPVGAGVEVWR